MKKEKNFILINIIIFIVLILMTIFIINILKINSILFMIILEFTIFSIYFLLFFLYKRKCDKKCIEISNYMNNVLNGDYSFDIRDYEEGSFSILKNDIYKLTIKLKEQTEIAIKEKNNLEIVLSDISHQIKTPLTSMHILNDLLLNSKLSKKEQINFLNKNKIQLEKLEWLVISLLKLSRLDNGFIKLEKKKINSKILIEKSLETILIPIELKKQKLIKNIKNFNFNIDLNWTVEAITNILKNAYEHTPSGGIIKIDVGDNPLYAFIKIEDNGVGISKKDLPHIFKRFYKGESQKESIGIGLNMAKKIIELQNGTITVHSEKNKYTIFEIRFYKNII